MIADLYNTPISNVNKLVPNFFDEKKYVLHYANLQLVVKSKLSPHGGFSLKTVEPHQ